MSERRELYRSPNGDTWYLGREPQNGHAFVIHQPNGPSGGRLLGRFCYADSTLDGYVREHLRAEEALHPGALFAEIVHLPQGRLGNILYRPVMREYEVPYLGRSGAHPEKQISVSDLTVSVRDGRIVLASRRLGREVIPRLTSAHNYNGPGNLGLYRFLCSLQHQGTASIGWDWGVLAGQRFLPRVTYGRLVLSRARWKFSTRELKEITETRGAQRFRAVQKLRTHHRLPRFLAVADGDNKLPIDLENVLSVDTLVEMMKQRQFIQLVEMFLTGSDELWRTQCWLDLRSGWRCGGHKSGDAGPARPPPLSVSVAGPRMRRTARPLPQTPSPRGVRAC